MAANGDFYLKAFLTEVKWNSGEMSHLNKGAMEISFSCLSHVVIICDCLERSILNFQYISPLLLM